MELIRIGSQTSAKRAERLLSANGIRFRTRRISGGEGCVHGIEVEAHDYGRAVKLLAHAGIAAR